VDEAYADHKPSSASPAESTTDSGVPKSSPSTGAGDAGGETLLLSQANAARMAQALDIPQLEIELERAIWQVETAIEKQKAEPVHKGSQPADGEKEGETSRVSGRDKEKSQ
jgi:hypothetical protein